jgi:Rps23 Pro-64 3,4-dihydroxylase Tpa1-like proline 4-hydroxylase
MSSSLYGRDFDRYQNQQSAKTKQFVEDHMYSRKIRPFDHYNDSALVKGEINKKLGSDLFNINLTRNYDPLIHQKRQKPLEESIKKLKEAAEKYESKSKPSTSASNMLENISIISK